jgi:hypothetical protein
MNLRDGKMTGKINGLHNGALESSLEFNLLLLITKHSPFDAKPLTQPAWNVLEDFNLSKLGVKINRKK